MRFIEDWILTVAIGFLGLSLVGCLVLTIRALVRWIA